MPPLVGYQGRNVWDKVIKGEPNYYGEKQNPLNPLAGALFGVRTTPANIEREKRFNALDYKNKIEELRSRLRSVYNNKSLSETDRLLKIKKLNEMIEETKKEYITR